MVRHGDSIETDDEDHVEDEMPELEDCNDVEMPMEGKLIVSRRALSTQVREDDEGIKLQRENIFHSRCLVNGKLCCIIIDGGSCVNMASTLFIDKLGLETTEHLKPYKLQWLNNSGEVRVNKQMRVPFIIGKYIDR